MRKTLLCILTITIFALAACGGKGDKKNSGGGGDKWQGGDGLSAKWVQADLGPGGFTGLTMRVPKGAEVTKAMKISKSDPDVAQINNNMGFTIWFSAKKLDLSKEKADIKKGSFYEGATFVAEEKDALIFKAKGMTGKPIFHFRVTLSVGGKHYVCQNATSVSFRERKLVDQMVASCRGES